MARPRKTVDESRIVELAAKGHTLKGIAAMLAISYDTLHRRFAGAYDKGQALLTDRIRVKQVEAALNQNGMKGTSVDRIWAGKQFAGQTDKQEIDVRKQVTERWVIGIAQSKLDKMLGGPLPQQQKQLEIRPESTSNEASESEQKERVQKNEQDAISVQEKPAEDARRLSVADFNGVNLTESGRRRYY